MGKKKTTQSPSKKTKNTQNSESENFTSSNGGGKSEASKQQAQKGKQNRAAQQKGNVKSKSTSSQSNIAFWAVVTILAVSVGACGVFFQEEIQTATEPLYQEYIAPKVSELLELWNGEKLQREERDIPQADNANVDDNNNEGEARPDAERERERQEEEARQRKQKEEEERQRKQKEEEERKRKQKEEEERKRKQKEEEERKRKQKEEEERQRKQKEEEERIRKQKEEEERQRKQKEEEERQRKQKEEEERIRKQKEEEERQRKQKEEEEKQRKQNAEEEKQKKQKEEEERQKKQKEEEERQRKLKEEEEKQRKQKGEEEKQKKQKEEEERQKKQKEEEERQRKLKEEEEKQRKQKAEEEKQKKQKEEEERQRKQKEEEERQRKLKEEEEKQRKQKAEEEKQKKQKEEEERQKKQKEEEERQRKLKEEEEKQRKQKAEEEKQKKQKEEEERQKKQKEEEERQRKLKEEEEKQRKQKEEEEKQKKQKEEEKQKKQKEEEERQRKQKEEEERKRKQKEEEEKQRLQKEEEERLRKQKEEEEKQKRLQEEAKVKAKKEKEEKEREQKEEKEKHEKTKEQQKAKQTVDRASYAHSAITNDEDLKITVQLDEADALLEKEALTDALRKYDAILNEAVQSPRAHYGKGLTLDKLGFKHQSNEYLEQAINFMSRTMALPDVPDELFKMAGRKLADRQQFRGWGGETVKTFRKLVKKFPGDLKLQNDLGVSYMMIGQNERAKDVFKQVLASQPNSGFAKVHMGFILKDQAGSMEEAVRMLREGVRSEEEGTQDGRFFLHLGDLLIRLGKTDEARQIYQEGEDKGLFISAWQRSLYNVDGLTSRPWWTVEQTGYTNFFKALKENWKAIRDEGLAQLNAKTGAFQPEDENLRDTGDWKQFTLFSQGRKNKGNCLKAPKTCALIEKFPSVEKCTRGQVKFSVMSPGIHVWPHTGPTNCRIRSHLGLVVPQGPLIRVMNETKKWKEGEVLIFDDSFEHEVWHEGSELRLVLIVDVWHPELTQQQKRTLSPI